MNLNSIMLGSENPGKLADFYTSVFGDPDWKDEENKWFGFRIGDGFLSIGPHTEVTGRNKEPGRIILNCQAPNVREEFDRIKATGAEVVPNPINPVAPRACGCRPSPTQTATTFNWSPHGRKPLSDEGAPAGAPRDEA